MVTFDEKQSAFEQLEADEIYKDGPFDVLFMFNTNQRILRNLLPLSPILVSCLGDNPLKNKFRRTFRYKHRYTEEVSALHRSQQYLNLLERLHKLDTSAASPSSPDTGNNSAAGTFIAPFSTLGTADSWEEQNWQELISKLPERPVLLALTQDKDAAEAMAGRLGLDCRVAQPEEIRTILGCKTKLYAVDGLLPQLAAHCNCRCTVLMSSRPVAQYGPMGKNDKAVYHHSPCHPCYRSSCDQGQDHCAGHISVEDVLNA